MSHVYYNELWLITRSDLEKLLELERELQESAPLKKRAALNSALSIYLRYRNIVRRLLMCYDQMIQTQKRELIKKMLDCAIGRMLEYKKEIVALDYTDYQWPDDILNQMKFTPDDIELFASVSGRERIEERRKFIQALVESAHKVPHMRERRLSQIQIESTPEVEDETLKKRAARRRMRIAPPSKVELIHESPLEKAAREAKLAAEKTMRNAMLLIQSHERARKGRIYGADVKHIYDYNKKVRSGEIIPKKIDHVRYIKSAVTIQRAWRRYAAKKAIKKRIARLEEALGMTIPSWRCNKTIAKDDDNFQRRRALMPMFDARTKKAISDERTKLLKIRGPGLMEDITDEIHEWFVIWYNALGHYDVFPAADLGGSVLIVTGQTLTPEEYLMEKLEKEKKAKERMGSVPKAEPIKSKVAGWKMPQTDTLSCLEEANSDLIRNWSFRDEKYLEQEYLDLITEKLCYELQLEMREIVDELMRAELELLNKALLKDHKHDKKKFTIPTTDKKRIDRIKTKKKDILEDVAIEDLFSELLQAEIIRNYQIIFLRDWFGDLSYQNYEARRELRDHKHRLGEVKQLVLEYCILPLISKETHQLAPLVRSVCIYGLPGAGKTSLVNAICSEIGALLFDVSAPVLANKYIGKEKQQRLINIISKVARFYAPSVIFLDAGEKPWLKNVPPEERYLQPKRFANYFVKLMKDIKPGDQILFLSLSEEPHKAIAAFIKFHDKFIRIPTTDYNTLYMYYKNLLMKYHGVDRNIDVSCLAKMSIGIPLNFIRQTVEKVLSLRRRITLKSNPLNPMEIMNEILMYQHPTTGMVENLDKFERSTPLGKKRASVS
ncbi:PREDICTED: IQ and AAA domain-containing protein 1-like [Trachymyrmex cornetzi]|uniref:IQ and AAA domain-containing protein 1-like n=1 Tax=Trachymyrmex cornetzi TaxID=471704 RepID=UPI00084ED717|nr:PREDICTED: IQ and AAA domain-containing protein 1-like [Trachymyrmex cornetzi]